jgi:hypothetical protein
MARLYVKGCFPKEDILLCYRTNVIDPFNR